MKNKTGKNIVDLQGERKKAFRSSLFFLPLSLFSIAVTIMNVPEKYSSGEWVKFSLLLAVFFVLVYGTFILVLMVVRLYTTACAVDLEADRIVAYNIVQAYAEMRYGDIERIAKHKRFNTILLFSGRGELELSPEIPGFGSVIEKIRIRAVNAKSVDYGGLDKKPKIWNGPGEKRGPGTV